MLRRSLSRMEAISEDPAATKDRLLSHGTPSRKLVGLPIARVIPMDVHTVGDYAGALTVAALSSRARSKEARLAGAALGAASIAVSLLTDYRISAVKLIPIEMHEVLDYVAGSASVAAPFVLGYRKRDRWVSAVQIASGVAEMLIALFTDYRAYRGRSLRFRR